MPTAKPDISVLVPVYCCADCLHELCARVDKALTAITQRYEIVLVCDGSPDDSWQVIEQLARSDAHVRGLLLSRNFGQHYAISAGLDRCEGEWVVVMDCDLQDRPEEIPRLYAKAQEGYDIVFGARARRQDGLLKRWLSRIFYAVLNYLSSADFDARTANFGIFHRRVVDAIRRMPEKTRFFPVQVKWVGFRRCAIEVEHGAREHGSSSYDLHKLLKLGADIILANSDKPLRVSAVLGLLISLLASVYALWTLVRYLRGEVSVLGYTSLITSIWLLGGLILFSLGVLGLYLGRVYESVKDRPIYLIYRDTRGTDAAGTGDKMP
ncbi:glycosyl transferase [Mizugakiibacter sediminis]|uniref:B-glycosyltransferase n=1 Tax=Mizugakiibacter sediminis TaxID=1475481 RepID=A0A0K8QMK7_9GAMM|nr:glycosyltransferase family 2 protein [Mizugakiibacter sediminis]GAP65642.1 glycosyl transferase [Mizugakiibacter sediminis]